MQESEFSRCFHIVDGSLVVVALVYRALVVVVRSLVVVVLVERPWVEEGPWVLEGSNQEVKVLIY